jgi:cathepsin C
MMEEVYNNGPVVVSFEPDYNFMMYKNGIYHSITDETWINSGMPKPEWEKVDHSVLLVGWGEENTGEKYWIIQNTWGPAWGEEGFFRMKRGSDEFGIESICETATPVIIDNKTKAIVNNPKETNGAMDNSIFDYFK